MMETKDILIKKILEINQIQKTIIFTQYIYTINH